MPTRQALGRRVVAIPPLYRVLATVTHPTRRGERFSALIRAVRHEIVTRWLGRPTILPLGERSKLIAYKGETNTPLAVVANPPNFPDMLVWRRYLQSGDLFLDVGANIGAYTIWAAELGAEVIAIEPNAHNAGRVREHLELNGYAGEVVEKALSDHPGIVRITSDRDSLNHLTGDGTGIEIEATTLDTVLGDRVAAGVKIDVEGAEALVLAGASTALNEHRISLLQVEWAIGDWMGTADRGDVRSILRSAGYSIWVADNTGQLNRVPEGTEPTALNVFARPITA